MMSPARVWETAIGSALSLALLLGSPTASRAQVSSRSPGSDVQAAMVQLPDGRRIHLDCSGAGQPTVLLDAGLGMDSTVWDRVRPDLAAVTRTCAYDRAGYGLSDPGPMPRDAERLTADLVALLEAMPDTGPYVLVAHSAAELPARLAAARRPDLVAGLVLVDPGPDIGRLKEIGPIWGAAYDAAQAAAMRCIEATAAGEMIAGSAIHVECGAPPLDGPLGSRSMAVAVLSENESGRNSSWTMAGGSLGSLPLIVLTATDKFGAAEGAAPDETERLRGAWRAGGGRIAALSARGEQRLVSGASHVIQFEKPGAVVDAVVDLLAVIRADAGSIR